MEKSDQNSTQMHSSHREGERGGEGRGRENKNSNIKGARNREWKTNGERFQKKTRKTRE